MMKELEYPFDSSFLRRKKKSIKRHLLEKSSFIEKKVAILGGSTTTDVRDMLELFLLNNGINPIFYESEYNKYWEDAVFGNPELDGFMPDVIYIHTSIRNIVDFPKLSDDRETIDNKVSEQFGRFEMMWNKLSEKFNCPIIQNNFEYPYYRILGNKDASDIHGKVNYITRLNTSFYEYSQNHMNMYINDINYQSAMYGLEKWSEPSYWYMYKYALCLDAIPTLAFNVANIIKSIYGRNKKALALDLDNTLWGGVIGDDGVEGIVIGEETSSGQMYSEFQKYLCEIKDLGILLNVVSKNDYDNAVMGMSHPQMQLHKDDFVVIKANWEPKSVNLIDMAKELSLMPDSFVFVDDNPAEREIVRQQIEGVGVPELQSPESYVQLVDRSGYFEVTTISQDDINRNDMYKKNIARMELQREYSDYNEYLQSLKMKACIRPFEAMYYARISQLTNKSNQFNLTTRRYSQEDIENMANNSTYITLYGQLEDKFGDNGIVSVIAGEKNDNKLDIRLWLMSCRVLKRNLEHAMMDELVSCAKAMGIDEIYGYYYPTPKNAMVKEFFGEHGFEVISADNDGNTVWRLGDLNSYELQNKVIEVLD